MRMDIPIAYFVALVQACFWFHPFLWWAGRQLALWRERACDEMVLASERTNSELYGRALLDVLLLAQGKNTTRYTALGIFERNVKIQTRLEKIMSYHKTPYQFRCEWILLIFFAFCFLPMGCYVFSDDVKPVRENQSSVKQTEDQITEKSVPVLKNKENIIIEFYVLASNKTTDEKEKALMASASGDASASGNDQSEYRSDILDGYEGVRWLPVLETLAEQWKRISIEKNAGVILRRKESDKGLEMEEVLVLIPSKERRIVPDDFEQINYESQNGMDQIKFSLTAEGGKRMKRLSMPLVEKSPKTARTPRFLAVVRVQENLRILVTAAPVYAELERHGLVQFEGISKKNSVSQPSVISCRENLKQIVLAFHNYYAIDNKFPPSATVDSKGKPLHSWRVLILPYLEQNDLYKKIRLNEPWDSEYNKQFHDQMPDVYRCTVKNYGPGMTIFSVVTGKEAAFPRWGLARGFENITDGTSNTLAVVERKKPVCWMDPTSDITFTEAVNNDINSSSGDGLGSAHKGGFWGARFDGRVDAIYDDELPMEKRKAVLTISGGERVDIPSHRTMVGEQETIPDQKIIEEQKIQQKIDAYQILTARIPIFDSKWLKNETLQAKAREEVEKFNTWRNEVNEKISTFTETLDPAGQSAFAFWQMNCIQFCHLTEEVTLCRELWDKEPSLRPILLFWVDYILIISEQSNNPDFHAELLKIKNMEDDSKRFHRMCDWLNSIRSKDTRDQSLKLMDKERYKIGQPIPEEILVLENKLNRQLCIINIYIQYNTFQPKYRTTAIKNCEEIAAELDKLEPNWRKRLSSPKR